MSLHPTRRRAVLHACSAAALILAAACADSTSPRVQPLPGGEGPASLRLVCRAEVAARTVACATPGAAEGLRADRIVGQGGGIKLTSSNVAVVADSFMFDVTVTNQLEYPVGTADGVNPDPNGIRPFFVDGIHTTAGTGSVTVANADGVGIFTATGQPYFAYPGILQPAATTAPRRWKLRFDPGVESFSFGLYISVPVPPGGGKVFFTIASPGLGATVGDSFFISVRIDSATYSIQSVRATVGDRTTLLQPDKNGFISGALHLDGLFGPQQLLVHVVTVHADTADKARSFTKDAPPVMVFSAPTNFTVARPNLRIDIDCLDDNPAGCVSVTAKVGATTLASGTGSIHTDVSLASYQEQRIAIDSRVVDSFGWSRFRTDTVYVQSSPSLVFADSAGKVALDVDSTRLLFADPTRGVWVRDRGTGVRTQVTGAVNLSVVFTQRGWLHPLGAIFTGGAGNASQVYDWRSGTLVPLGVATNAALVAKGGWAVWTVPGSLLRRDLAAGTNVTVTPAAAAFRDVAENGDVVFTDGTLNIRRYRDGVTTPITADVVDTRSNFNPVTDGASVLWVKTYPMRDEYNDLGPVYLWQGATAAPLTAFDVTRFTTPYPYAANNGWIAYPMLDGGGATQIRTRAPDGTDRQVTSSGTSSLLRALGPDGTVVYAIGNALFAVRAPYTAPATRLGRDWFTVRFRGPELRLFLGNTAFHASY